MNNYDYLGLGLKNDLMSAHDRNMISHMNAQQNMAYGSDYFNSMSMNANVIATKSPFEIAREIRERNPSMQVNWITEK